MNHILTCGSVDISCCTAGRQGSSLPAAALRWCNLIARCHTPKSVLHLLISSSVALYSYEETLAVLKSAIPAAEVELHDMKASYSRRVQQQQQEQMGYHRAPPAFGGPTFGMESREADIRIVTQGEVQAQEKKIERMRVRCSAGCKMRSLADAADLRGTPMAGHACVCSVACSSPG